MPNALLRIFKYFQFIKKQLCAIPQEDWESYSMDTQCVKPAQPTADFVGKTLAEVVAAHAAMDKGLGPTDGGANEAGWWPHCFFVVVREDVEERGLMLVYVDDAFDGGGDEEEERGHGDGAKNGKGEEEDAAELGGPTLKKFFFRPGDMGAILSSIALSDEDPSWIHQEYDMDAEDTDMEDGE
ncbi:hypothetical protein N0V90_010612 [Kalmusia sp. IMI 367209]|nr:hypothetical protein N0V90_010612 [Kalmusia sp. IMI 367209]